MHFILWEFRVPEARRAAFETAYDSNGAWAQLFAKGDGFLGVELLRSSDDAGRYVTVDRWRSRERFDAFKRDFGAAYAALDRSLDGIAASETRIGAFDAA